ncbi:MAG: hypothetical protein H6562_19575 [Lewinellaceae bacterium]|nr:hypothetical protein [Lewinella sp.]MCB9281098.1 hypothetical protein [Lewinellaceae bacterium]
MRLNIKSFFIPLGLLPLHLSAQGPVTGFFPEGGETVLALTLADERFDRYNFGDEPREAVQRSGSVSFFMEHGLRDHTSLIVTAPYIWVDADDRGFQDVSVWLKYRNGYRESGAAKWTTATAVGLSFPIADYPTMSSNPIGQKATYFQGRLVVQYQAPFGVFFHLQSGIDFQIIPTVRQAIPVLFRAGAGSRIVFAEAWLEYYNTLSNGIDQTLAAGEGSDWLRTGGTLYFTITPAFGLYANGAFMLGGQNVGLSRRFGVGFVLRI